jgi:hypothetical protein
MLSSPSGRP